MTATKDIAADAVGAAFQEFYVEADGFRIRYMEAGEGDPVVWLHGGGGLRLSGAHDLMAEHYRVIAFELPGYGASPENTRSNSMADLGESMRAAVAALGLESYDLIANAFSARIALWMAIQQPDAIKALVLVSPAAIRSAEPLPPPSGPEEMAARLYAHPDRQPPMPPVQPEIEAKQRRLAQRVSGAPRDPELESAMADLNIPVLALFGTKDPIIPHTLARHYREILPNCSLMMVYDAAHAIDADRPEALSSIVQDFLEAHEGFLVTHKSGVLHP